MLGCVETSVLIFSMAPEGCIVVSVWVLSHPGHPVASYLTLRGNIVVF